MPDEVEGGQGTGEDERYDDDDHRRVGGLLAVGPVLFFEARAHVAHTTAREQLGLVAEVAQQVLDPKVFDILFVNLESKLAGWEERVSNELR